jgi:hypothetical protein
MKKELLPLCELIREGSGEVIYHEQRFCNFWGTPRVMLI